MVNGFNDDCDDASSSPISSSSTSTTTTCESSSRQNRVDEFPASKMASRQLPSVQCCNRQIVIITLILLLLLSLVQPPLLLILLLFPLLISTTLQILYAHNSFIILVDEFTTVSNKSLTWNDPYFNHKGYCLCYLLQQPITL